MIGTLKKQDKTSGGKRKREEDKQNSGPNKKPKPTKEATAARPKTSGAPKLWELKELAEAIEQGKVNFKIEKLNDYFYKVIANDDFPLFFKLFSPENPGSSQHGWKIFNENAKGMYSILCSMNEKFWEAELKQINAIQNAIGKVMFENHKKDQELPVKDRKGFLFSTLDDNINFQRFMDKTFTSSLRRKSYDDKTTGNRQVSFNFNPVFFTKDVVYNGLKEFETKFVEYDEVERNPTKMKVLSKEDFMDYRNKHLSEANPVPRFHFMGYMKIPYLWRNKADKWGIKFLFSRYIIIVPEEIRKKFYVDKEEVSFDEAKKIDEPNYSM